MIIRASSSVKPAGELFAAAPRRASSSKLRISAEGLCLPSPEVEALNARRAQLDEDSCCSFDEWRGAGYAVCRGEKSLFRDIEGVPQFTKEQVTKS